MRAVDDRTGGARAGAALRTTGTQAAAALLLAIALVALTCAVLVDGFGSSARALVGAGGAWGALVGGLALRHARRARPRRGRHRAR